MNNPFLISLNSRITYYGIWILLAVIQMLLCYFNTNQEFFPVLIDSLVSCGLYLLCISVLWYPLSYYKNVLNIPLFLLFHLLLLILCLIICTGGTILTFISFYPNDLYNRFFIETLPYRILVDTFIYLVAVLSYYLTQAIHEFKKQSEEIITLQNETSAVPEEILNRIAVKKNKEIRFISIQDIQYIEANGDYVLIYTSNGRFLKDKTMKYLETHLPTDQFVRIHRSFIINIECLVKLELYEKEMYQVELKGGVRLKVSNAGYKLLKQKLQ
jgi:DNA-binding LytR/AlgR family response regulator